MGVHTNKLYYTYFITNKSVAQAIYSFTFYQIAL